MKTIEATIFDADGPRFVLVFYGAPPGAINAAIRCALKRRGRLGARLYAVVREVRYDFDPRRLDAAGDQEGGIKC